MHILPTTCTQTPKIIRIPQSNFIQQQQFWHKRMMQKLANQTYKISSLSPSFLSTQYNNFPKRKSPKSSKIQPFAYNLISEDPEENLQSPKFKENKNKKHALSDNQIGVVQCNVFEKKLKIRKHFGNQNVGVEVSRNNRLGEDIETNDLKIKRQKSNEEYGFNQNINESEEKDNNRLTRLNFVEQYRSNLRKTVFNQTKLMIKSKRSKVNYSFQTLDSSKSNNLKLTTDPQKLQSKLSLHSQRTREQKKTIDSLYKTITTNQKLPRLEPSNDELEVSKFPLILKTKQQLTINYSNLLSTLNTKQRQLRNAAKQHKLAQRKRKSRNGNRMQSKQSNGQKHQLKPWETFADQFIE